MRSAAAPSPCAAISGAFDKGFAKPGRRRNKGAAQRPLAGGNSETAVTADKSHKRQDPDTRITVLFGLDNSALSGAEKARLSFFVKSLDAETKAGNLFVTGYTCDLGTKDHNDVLAMKRAEAVETYLRKAGLRAMWVTGMGKCCYATKDPEQAIPQPEG